MRPLDPVFAMAESAFLDDGSHLDQKDISADHDRRNETCWPFPTAASRPRTLSLTTAGDLVGSWLERTSPPTLEYPESGIARD